MGGNRKHGFLRGNRGGFKPEPWKCDVCDRLHNGRVTRYEALDGTIMCERQYNKRLSGKF